MSSYNTIREPILQELESFEKMYKEASESDVELMQMVVDHVLSTQGKKIRPIFTLLSAGVFAKPSAKAIRVAIMLETLHTASLMHDDVVDNSALRRNKETVNHLFSNKIAILSGDYFLAVVLNLLSKNGDYEFLEILSNTVQQMASGELLQQQKSNAFDFLEKSYFEIIEKKTGVLIASCCKAGAISAGATSIEIEQMEKIGTLIGTAFQIKDDILDYLPAEVTGKQPGNDLREQKITLPLIYYFNQKNKEEQQILSEAVKNQNQDNEFVASLMKNIESSNAISQAQYKVEELCNEALVILSPIKESVYKKSFIEAVNYVMERSC